MVLALSLAAGPLAWAQTSPTTASPANASPATASPSTASPTDRPDGGPPLLDPNIPHQTTTGTDERPPGLPPPRAMDTKRAPVPDRLALPEDMQNIPLAPPTPYVPPLDGAKNGGGPNRVKQILSSPGAGQDVPRGSVTRTPEDQVPMPSPGR
jgi:hypothetical protein